ncbi:unnamed protein product [Mesocestoides corti]|uniref:Uncharacterized protein n=1 Tax=Mesocestoides corti TaxID=53468 RepID=A0A0R3U487_MESCO|nr:unnamed protein product [Mesocestoides corti]
MYRSYSCLGSVFYTLHASRDAPTRRVADSRQMAAHQDGGSLSPRFMALAAELRIASILGATSRDQRGDSLLRGVTRAFNDAPGTESQSAHELSVSIAAPRNGPTGRQAEQDKDT